MSCSCLAEAIAGMSIDLILRRPPSGYYDEHGVYKPRDREDISFRGSVQPLNPKELVDLPENRRSRESIKIYTSTPLRTVEVSGQTQPDIVLYHGIEYQIDRVFDWGEVAGYYKALATKRGQ